MPRMCCGLTYNTDLGYDLHRQKVHGDRSNATGVRVRKAGPKSGRKGPAFVQGTRTPAKLPERREESEFERFNRLAISTHKSALRKAEFERKTAPRYELCDSKTDKQIGRAETIGNAERVANGLVGIAHPAIDIYDTDTQKIVKTIVLPAQRFAGRDPHAGKSVVCRRCATHCVLRSDGTLPAHEAGRYVCPSSYTKQYK